MLQELHIPPMVAGGHYSESVEIIIHPTQFEALQDSLQMQVTVFTHDRSSSSWS
jgi:hypothetical protein